MGLWTPTYPLFGTKSQKKRFLTPSLTSVFRWRPVHFGTKKLGKTGIAKHWALKVGDRWYEIGGAGKWAIGQPNTIEESHGECSLVGACPDPKTSLLGRTRKTDTEIADFNTAYLGTS